MAPTEATDADDGGPSGSSEGAATTPGPDPALASHAGLPGNVRTLSWVSFFADASSEMLYPVFPIFVTQTLGASAAVLGLIEGIAEGTASIGKAISGRLADRRKRRPMIALGYSVSSVAKPVIGLARSWPLALIGRFVDRAGKGIRDSPRDAVVATDTSQANRGRSFGFQRAFDTAGAVAGPLVGLGLYEALGHHIRQLFFIALIPGAISVALVFRVRERRSTRAESDRARHRSRMSAAPAGGLPRRYWELLVVLGMFNLMNFSDSLLILRAKGVGLSFAEVILVYALFNASYAVLSYPAGAASDRVPRRVIYAAGLLIFAASYLGLGLAHARIWVWLLFAVYGGYWALTGGVGRAWVADLSPPELQGTGLGLYQCVTGACVLIAGVWAGLAWNGTGRVPADRVRNRGQWSGDRTSDDRPATGPLPHWISTAAQLRRAPALASSHGLAMEGSWLLRRGSSSAWVQAACRPQAHGEIATATQALDRNPAAKRDVLEPAARLGLTARAVMYLLIGVLAILVATGHTTTETDQWGAMQQLNRRGPGHLVLWVVALGLAGYSLWRFSEAALGVVGEGKKAGPRLKSFGRGCIYAVIAFMAFQIATGGGSRSQASRQVTLSSEVMRHTGGRVVVALVGVAVATVGATLVYEGATRKFERYLELSGCSRATRRVVRTIGVIGTVARGAVFTLAGIFVIQAAWVYQPKKAAGLDRALRSLRDTPAGPWLLGVFATGLVLFGLYGLAEARWLRI